MTSLSPSTDEWLTDSLVELYKQWCRLKGYKPAKSPIEVMVDKATGAQDARMQEFAHWFRTEILTRLPAEAQLQSQVQGLKEES